MKQEQEVLDLCLAFVKLHRETFSLKRNVLGLSKEERLDVGGMFALVNELRIWDLISESVTEHIRLR